MTTHRKTGWMLTALVASSFAIFTGCATTGGSLSTSAERLERNASALQRESREDGARTSYSKEAGELAQEARDFRRVLQDRSPRKGELDNAFADLSRRYHALRDEMDRTRSSRDADVEFKKVTDAYLDVEREMRKHGRYATR